MSDVIIAGTTYPDVPAVDLNKSGGGIARYYEPSEILYAASPTSGGSAIYANGIHYAQVDATSTATVFTATIDGITEYYDGLTIILKNGIITSESGFTININNLGAKPCYSSMATATRETTIFNINYTMMFVYDSSRVSGGCWVCYHGYNALSNATPAALGTASAGSSSETARADHVHEKPTYTAADVGAVPLPSSASTDNVLAYNGSAWVADKRTVILSYGHSTWQQFLDAYNANAVIYCRASSNSNPATGSQTRMAFMAYVNNADNPTNVEFQYYRSVNQHSVTQQGDQVYVYKLDKTAGWTVTVRENYTKIVAGSGLSSAYSSGTLTLSNGAPVPTGGTTGQVLKKNSGTNYDCSWADESGGGGDTCIQIKIIDDGDGYYSISSVVPSSTDLLNFFLGSSGQGNAILVVLDPSYYQRPQEVAQFTGLEVLVEYDSWADEDCQMSHAHFSRTFVDNGSVKVTDFEILYNLDYDVARSITGTTYTIT